MKTNGINSTTSHFKSINAETRRYRRISLQLPTEYSLKGSSITRFGHTINICEEGLVICIREKYEVGQNLRVKVFFSTGSDCVFIDTRTEVVWRNILEQRKKEYVCGLRFIEMSHDDLKKLRIFLKSFSEAAQEQKCPTLFGLRIWKERSLKKR